MRARQPVGYVVQIDGGEITLNLLDQHKGHVASHVQGVSAVTEISSLLAIDGGNRLLVLKVLGLSFAEPREAHKFGVGSSSIQGEPLRHLKGIVVGWIHRRAGLTEFYTDSLATPSLGAEAFPLSKQEYDAILGQQQQSSSRIVLGENLRGGGSLVVGLSDLLSRHVAVLGSSGQGKSCFTAATLQQIAQFPRCRVVIFDINGEYADALEGQIDPESLKQTRVGKINADDQDGFRIPYYALGRHGLQRLLLPSEKTQRPALSFATDNLKYVRWVDEDRGVSLSDEDDTSLYDDCRDVGADQAEAAIRRLRHREVPEAEQWPNMLSLAALVAESHSIAPDNRHNSRTDFKRDAFSYGNVSPLITRIRRLVEDEMFTSVVNISGGPPTGTGLHWHVESSNLVSEIFGSDDSSWKFHLVDLRMVAQDLMPLVLGSLLELYAYELFRRGQGNSPATLLVLEEAHHYLRPIGFGEEAKENSLAYERLAKEGRKFGLSLWLSTQRPSEISQTVLSQCNTWISFRLASDQDLNAISSATEWVDKREIRRIAGLARQNAIVFGGSVAMPTLIRANDASPLPRSEDAAFDQWAEEAEP